ncbi:DUF3713 domain-containing protein [Mycoplasma bradburyae]|uniref:DUF3713 domain-containing protein n=1 Tax=Mycoplasma bradburyae TaxID=2963128 RepID=UPI0023413E4F|nr:DUF3713 domain-containing protein [Mycoplasma bradburyae]MDC4182356.1 DUF3713 domain-containing protein [Mycoplasma bradburyae]
MFQNNNKKRRITRQISLLSLISFAGIIASSCGNVANNQLNRFNTGYSNNGENNINQGFVNGDESILGGYKLQAQSVLTTALKNNQGFQTLLSTLLAESLSNYYKDSKSQVLKNKYENFSDDIKDQLDTSIKDNKKLHGNEYEDLLQTQLYDSNGGTKESYLKNQLNQKIIRDFLDSVFETQYLNYAPTTSTNTDGLTVYSNLTKIPSRETLSNPENWKNIKFTNGGFSKTDNEQNNKEFLAQIQANIFDSWVTNENPNLVSRIVFTNDTPKDGLNSIFNDRVVNASSLVAGYNFQAFKNPKDQPFDENKGMRAYNQFIRNGLDSYVNDKTKGIDIPNNFSSDAGGKLLMTASDMFNSYDVSFSAAFVQQYLRQTNNPNKDNVGNVQSSIDEINLMNNFIRMPSDDSASSTWDQAVANDSLLKEGSANRTKDPYYKAYADLAAGTKKIFEIFEWDGNKVMPSMPVTRAATTLVADGAAAGTTAPATPAAAPAPATPTATATTTANSKNTKADKFIFARGKDGIHVIAIDGGEYYLNSTEQKRRDISKQKEFLAYRSLLRSSVSLADNEKYDFSLENQVKSYYDKDQTLNLYLALSKMYEEANENPKDLNNIFNIEDGGNFSFKTSFKKVYDLVNDLVKSQVEYQRALDLDTQVQNIRAKIYERAKAFDDNQKNNQPGNNGIAAKLPYVRSADGSYNGLEQYYLATFGLTGTNATTGTTKSIENNIKQKREARDVKIKDLLTKLKVETVLINSKSQNTFIDIKAEDEQFSKWENLKLALNLVLGSIISSSLLTNEIKTEFIKSSKGFKEFYDVEHGDVWTAFGIDKTTLKNVIRNVYQFSVFSSLSDKTSKGVYNSFSTLNGIVNNLWNDQRLDKNPSSELTFNYYKYLYTLQWLLRNNLQNFKQIAKTSIKPGEVAFATWSLPVNLNMTSSTDTNNNPLTKFDANPDGILGSKGSNWKNIVSSEASKIAEPNYWNNSSLTYKVSASEDSPKSPQYGFAGLVFKDSSAPIAEEVKSALFTTYSSSGEKGTFFGYGNKDNLIAYVDSIKSERELDSLANRITDETRVPSNDYFKKDDKNNPLSYDKKLEEIKKMINLIPASAFERFVGYIGNKKEENYDLNNTLFVKGSLRRIATYVKQISYSDVDKLGAGWLTDSNKALGLSQSELLTIIAMTANNSAIQTQALTSLVNNKKLTVRDVRLFGALGSFFAKKIN